MITVYSSNLTFRVDIDGDKIDGGMYVLEYLKGRCMLQVSTSSTQLTKLSIFFSGTDANNNAVTTDMVFYYTDPSGKLRISLRDILRWLKEKTVAVPRMTVCSYPTVDSAVVDDIATADLKLLEGISYYAVGAPHGKDVNDTTASRIDCIMPPNVILNPSCGAGVMIESNYTLLNANGAWNLTAGGTLKNLLAPKNNDRTLELSDNGTTIKVYNLADVDCCQDLLAVAWTSLTGGSRMHYFPIVSYIRGNGDKVEIESPHDGYDVLKENFTAVRCRLTGLTQWGYYYYMDLLQASDPFAIILEPNDVDFWTKITSPSSKVYIEGDSAETPSGPGFFNFEFVCNLKQYGI